MRETNEVGLGMSHFSLEHGGVAREYQLLHRAGAGAAEKKPAAEKKDSAPEALPLDKQVEAPPKNFDLNEIDL